MGYTAIGRVTIGKEITTIRKYENGFYVVELSKEVKYSSDSLEKLEKLLQEDNINYKITGPE